MNDTAARTALPTDSDRAVLLAANWLSLLMIQKPLPIDDAADEQAEAEAAKARMSADHETALRTLRQQARTIERANRKIVLR